MKKNVREIFHVSKLQREEIRRRYNIEVRYMLEALGDRGSRGRSQYDFGNIKRCSKEHFGEVKET